MVEKLNKEIVRNISLSEFPTGNHFVVLMNTFEGIRPYLEVYGKILPNVNILGNNYYFTYAPYLKDGEIEMFPLYKNKLND